jgi:hypothetical protein
MSTYPQGVTSFIPDYQPYQPDFNFAANILQLKQSQYDSNWSKLNNLYGQLLNAPLTHDDSKIKRDNTFKRIDFDLKRITGLDLSLDQNVNQATQLFKPFYEDSNLMKDMALTKNASFEKSLGEGKRISTDKAISDEYWQGGIDLIDYRLQEFKNTPYDQLTSFGDIKYIPFVNADKMAQEMAIKLKYKVKTTTPQGDWIVTEQNGNQIIAPLKSIFYGAIGKDPKVRAFYGAEAYLKRKNYIEENKNNPEYKGNPELAEKKYLDDELKSMSRQSQLSLNNLENQKKVNDNIISKLEKSIANGNGNSDVEASLVSYQEANDQITALLEQNKDDLQMLNGNLTNTLGITGGSKVSRTDIDQLRSRVDNVKASTLLQNVLDKSVYDYAFMNYEKTYDPNPFAVQRQKYQYDSSLVSQRLQGQSALINQRIQGQKEVAKYKYDLGMDAAIKEAKLKSKAYKLNSEGELVEDPDLFNARSDASFMSSTDGTDPDKLLKMDDQIKTSDASNNKKLFVAALEELSAEGVLSQEDLTAILSDPNAKYSNEMMDKLAKQFQFGESAEENERRSALYNSGVYETSLEKQMKIEPTAAEKNQQVITSLKGELKKILPETLTRLNKRLITVIEKKRNIPEIKNSANIKQLIISSQELENYATYEAAATKNRIALAKEKVQRLQALGHVYAEFKFDENGYERSFSDWKATVAKYNPEAMTMDNGASWGEFWNYVAAGGGAGATAGLFGGPLAPLTSTAGFFGGMAAAAIGYGAKAGLTSVWNSFSDDPGLELAGVYNGFGANQSPESEYNAMLDSEIDLIADGQFNTNPLPLWNSVDNTSGTGKYTSGGTRVSIEPGVMSPSMDYYIETSQFLNKLDMSKENSPAYVSVEGISADAEKLDITKWNAIYNDFKKQVYQDDSKLGRFDLIGAGLAAGDSDKGAINFKFGEEYMKKWKPDADGEGSILTQTEYDNFLKNGVSIVTDFKAMSGLTIFKNLYKSQEQIVIDAAGKNGKTYTSPLYKGIEYNVKNDPYNEGMVTVTTTYPQYMGPGKAYEQKQLVTSLSAQGNNLKMNREKFFNGDPNSENIDAEKIEQSNYNNEKTYGKGIK